jgi:plastocyanin
MSRVSSPLASLLATSLTVAAALASSVALADYATAEVAGGGTITGKVTMTGAAPALPPEKRDKNPEVCGTTFPNQTLQVSSTGGIKFVIVYLQDITKGKAMTIGNAELNQEKCAYHPHAQAIPVGTTLTVLNSDPILHNVHASLGATTVFNYAMPLKGQKIPKKLSKAGFVKLKCDVHSWMNGAIAVMDNPYFAVTDDEGHFTIDNVPPGSYTIAVWHERLGEKSQPVTVAAGANKADISLPAK